MNKLFAPLLLVISILLKLGGENIFWQKVPLYYSYLFEIVFIVVTASLLKLRAPTFKVPSLFDLASFLGLLTLGFTTFKFANHFEIMIPFDFNLKLNVFLLLVVAPILEELVFRYALWEALQRVSKKWWVTLLGTSFLFSAAHFTSFWAVPALFKSFVIYQTCYTAVLGVIAGLPKLKRQDLSTSIFLHFCFNLGFLIAFFY
jgi:membrane protease YdiL (CAAX protease family)